MARVFTRGQTSPPVVLAAARPNQFRTDALFRKETGMLGPSLLWALDQRELSVRISITNDAQGPAKGCGSRTTSTVGVCSTARRSRNHTLSGTRCNCVGGTGLRSSANNPNPPPTSSHSAARKACSKRLHRTQSRRSRSTPAAYPEAGSKASEASTSPQVSPRAMEAASILTIKLVLPEQGSP